MNFRDCMYHKGLTVFCLRDTYSAEQDGVLSRVVRHAEHRELRPTRTR